MGNINYGNDPDPVFRALQGVYTLGVSEVLWRKQQEEHRESRQERRREIGKGIAKATKHNVERGYGPVSVKVGGKGGLKGGGQILKGYGGALRGGTGAGTTRPPPAARAAAPRTASAALANRPGPTPGASVLV